MIRISRGRSFWSSWRPLGMVEDFFDAVDSDDVERATALMKRAEVDAATIATVIRKMEEADGQH
jgi:hypothetical protein